MVLFPRRRFNAAADVDTIWMDLLDSLSDIVGSQPAGQENARDRCGFGGQ